MAAREPYRDPDNCSALPRHYGEGSVRQAWRREKKRNERQKKSAGGAGINKILSPDQHQALPRYAADHATGGGMGATKQMMFSCAMWLRAQEGKTAPSWRWFQLWLKNTPNFIPSRRNRLRAPRRYAYRERPSANGSRRNTGRRSNTPE